MPRKRIEQGYNQLTLTDGASEQEERASYVCQVVAVPEYKKSKKRWQCMVRLLPDLWVQDRDQFCFVLAQKQAAVDADKLALIPGDVVKIGGAETGKQRVLLQGGSEMSILRFSLSTISVFSRAPRLQPQSMSNGIRRLLA